MLLHCRSSLAALGHCRSPPNPFLLRTCHRALPCPRCSPSSLTLPPPPCAVAALTRRVGRTQQALQAPPRLCAGVRRAACHRGREQGRHGKGIMRWSPDLTEQYRVLESQAKHRTRGVRKQHNPSSRATVPAVRAPAERRSRERLRSERSESREGESQRGLRFGSNPCARSTFGGASSTTTARTLELDERAGSELATQWLR